MKYNSYSKDELIKKIHTMEKAEKKELYKRDEMIRSQYLSTGYLGPWYWNVQENTIMLNPVQQEMFKLDGPKKLSFDDYMSLVHDADKELVKNAFTKHIDGDTSAVEIEYRLLFNDGNHHWLYHRAETDEIDEINRPIQVMGIIMDITEKRNTFEHLNNEKKIHEKNATLDFLTNLLNRRGFHLQTSRFLQGTHSINMPISIAMFDIDNFKQANDLYGHEYGDQILLEIADLLRENTRSEDILSRFGGDEFLLIFIGLELDKAYDVCERIRITAEKKYQESDVNITLSGGVKVYEKEEVAEVIKKVDNLLYKAKKSGKNKIVKWTA